MSDTILFGSDIIDLSKEYYYATSCKDDYDTSKIQWLLVGVGNNVFGANHDYASIYRKQLLDYFSDNNEAILQNKSQLETINSYNTLINQVNTCARNVVSICDGLARDRYFRDLEQLQLIIKNYSHVLVSLRHSAGNATTIGEVAVDCINKIHSYSISVNNVAHKFDTLDNIYQNKIVVFTNKITGDGTTALGRILYVGLGFMDAVSDAIMINAMSGLIQENIEVVKEVMYYSDYEAQSFAAAQIYGEIENSGFQVLDTAFNYVTAVAKYGVDGEIRIAIADLCPVAATIVAGVAISDFTFKVSDTAKSIITTIGDAMLGNVLYNSLLKKVSPLTNTIHYNDSYVLNESNMDISLTLYYNLICARIQGENTVIATLEQYPLLYQAYLSVWGIDCIDAISDCERNIENLIILQNKM